MAIKDKALRGLGLLLSLIRLYAQSQGAEFKIKPPLQITVHVYNAARVPSGDLIRAEENAARIFKKAQVIVIWAAGVMPTEVNHQAAHEQWNPGHLQLRIWTRSMAQPSIVDSDVLGFCTSIEDGHAVVLFDAVRRLAGVRFSNPADLLGLAMAHEMGHVLLRSVNHSAAGIMRAQWLPKDFRDAEAELLVFTREQADSMRAEVRRRLALGWLPPSETISAASRQSLAQGDLSEAVPRPCLSIRLYDLAGVAPKTLDSAAEEAARILATAAVDIVWQPGPADSPEAHTLDQTGYRKGQHPKPDTGNYLVVCIRHGDPASAFPGSLGFALPDARLGVHATIFYDRIEEVTKLVIITVPKMLGHVMAHEIGHVLLGSTEHSSAGIMKAIWDRNDFQYDPAARMEFTPEQRSVIRERASVRVLLQPE